jgi:IS5 family transposase
LWRPKELEQMLRIYFVQQWFNLADPVEEALYDSATLRQFVGIDLGAEPVPDETTVCKFRHLLEEHHLGEEILGTDATLIHAPSSTKNREHSRDPEMHQAKKGKNWYFEMKAHGAWTARPRSFTRRWRRQLKTHAPDQTQNRPRYLHCKLDLAPPGLIYSVAAPNNFHELSRASSPQ